MIETIDAERITNSAGHLRLWDGDTHHHLWSNHSEPASERRALVDVLAERDGWTAATFDWPNRGRVWAGRMRVSDNGDVEAAQELEFLAGVGFCLYSESGVVEQVPADE